MGPGPSPAPPSCAHAPHGLLNSPRPRPHRVRRKNPHDPARTFVLDRAWRDRVTKDRRDGLSTATAHAIVWWLTWLQLEDQMPNEPTIVHREIRWENVYDKYRAEAAAMWPDYTPLKSMCTITAAGAKPKAPAPACHQAPPINPFPLCVLPLQNPRGPRPRRTRLCSSPSSSTAPSLSRASPRS